MCCLVNNKPRETSTRVHRIFCLDYYHVIFTEGGEAYHLGIWRAVEHSRHFPRVGFVSNSRTMHGMFLQNTYYMFLIVHVSFFSAQCNV